MFNAGVFEETSVVHDDAELFGLGDSVPEVLVTDSIAEAIGRLDARIHVEISVSVCDDELSESQGGPDAFMLTSKSMAGIFLRCGQGGETK